MAALHDQRAGGAVTGNGSLTPARASRRSRTDGESRSTTAGPYPRGQSCKHARGRRVARATVGVRPQLLSILDAKDDGHDRNARPPAPLRPVRDRLLGRDRKSTRLNSSHANISYAVFCLKKKKIILFT